jgi:hypothetical protein
VLSALRNTVAAGMLLGLAAGLAPGVSAQGASDQIVRFHAVELSSTPMAAGMGQIRYYAPTSEVLGRSVTLSAARPALQSEVLGRSVNLSAARPVIQSVDTPEAAPEVMVASSAVTTFNFRDLVPNTLYSVVAPGGIDSDGDGVPDLRAVCVFVTDGGGSGTCVSQFSTSQPVRVLELRQGGEDGMIVARML